MGDIVETLPRFSTSHEPSNYHRPVPAVLSHAAKLVFCVYAVFIAYESLVPSGAVQSIPHLDKVAHAGAYFVFAFLLSVASPRLSLKAVFALAFGFGAIMEIGQGIIGTGRTASLGDLLANGLGAILAVGTCFIVLKRLRRG